jgi:RNA polymerase sigma factor (sigma-70 family)
VARWRRRIGSRQGPECIIEPEGFAHFYARTYPALLRYLARRTQDAQVAIELTAETYAKAFEKRERFRGSTTQEAAGWVWAIAHNELRMYWRTRAVELAALERTQLPRPEPDDAELARIDDLLAAERERGPLREALEKLPADQQDVIQMHVIEEREHAEIAAELGVSTDVVRARLSRGLRRLAASDSLTRRRW